MVTFWAYLRFQALDLQLIYKGDTGQVTCRATIIHDSRDPASDTAGNPRSDSGCVPGGAPIV